MRHWNYPKLFVLGIAIWWVIKLLAGGYVLAAILLIVVTCMFVATK